MREETKQYKPEQRENRPKKRSRQEQVMQGNQVIYGQEQNCQRQNAEQNSFKQDNREKEVNGGFPSGGASAPGEWS